MAWTVLVEGNLIKKVAKGDIETRDDAKVIDGGGRTLMPGLIDMHTHVMCKYGVGPTRIDIDHAAAGAIALETMQFYMRMGYTTLRDVGGNSLGLSRALAAGRISGPRLYSSGGAISGISGHADLGLLTENPREDVFRKRGDTNVATGRIRFVPRCAGCFEVAALTSRSCQVEEWLLALTPLKPRS